MNLCVLAGENPGDYYSVLIVVTGLALLIKYVQITTVYSLFSTMFCHVSVDLGPNARIQGR
jgi:hypothetical protein